ncbi:hypothetical protein IVB16_31705 [Bradyrhizobium sp. 183]|uniref:hypothetical protein n=1 Tax=unclassified Bradyrhizobium TaxID=2631580 RepID=UPI001FFF759C|nr:MULTISPECIES: hypothetical protein [unclassified Bradyrhizobium]UPJ79290.1 hypothetical protein IVB17_31705 [Bradyrhizobium sp. 184]UPJ87083.1 hypothetical protein IVB16_31705 [Bradyrhizobium sp. 183]
MEDVFKHIEWWIWTWFAISAPNERAKDRAAEVVDLIHRVESLRGTLRFDDEPASFEAALIKGKGAAQ